MRPLRASDSAARITALEALGDELAERHDRTLGMVFALNERLVSVETKCGMDIPAELRADRMTVQRFAYQCGRSEPAIRKAIREGRLGHVWLGGRVFIVPRPGDRYT